MGGQINYILIQVCAFHNGLRPSELKRSPLVRQQRAATIHRTVYTCMGPVLCVCVCVCVRSVFLHMCGPCAVCVSLSLSLCVCVRSVFLHMYGSCAVCVCVFV